MVKIYVWKIQNMVNSGEITKEQIPETIDKIVPERWRDAVHKAFGV